MSKRLVGIKEIAACFPFTDEQTVRKKHIPKMVEARAVFISKVGKHKVWTYWTTENLLERYLINAAEDDGRI